MKDPNLKRCSHAAKGVWIDLLCLMFECTERGVLVTGNRAWSREDAAAAVGGNADVTMRCIDELVAKEVCKVRARDGALFSKRMMADEALRASTRDRVSAFRKRRCNGHVTSIPEDEDETEKVDPKIDPEAEVPIPNVLLTEAFKAKWAEYVEYRRETNRPKLAPLSVKRQWVELAGWGHDAAIQSIDQTIRQGWQGLFPPKPNGGATTATKPLRGAIMP